MTRNEEQKKPTVREECEVRSARLRESGFATFERVLVANVADGFLDGGVRSNDDLQFLLLRLKMNGELF